MLGGWDGRLTVLLRKRVNRHVERCAMCSQRREEEMTPAVFLGMAPLIALPLAGALPGALRDQVMRAVFGNSPAAVAHRAAVGRTPYSFGHHGFPQPLHPLRPPWWQQHMVHYGTAAGTAAVIAAGVTLAALPPPHHPGGHQARGGPSAVATGTSPAAAGTRPPATGLPAARRHAPRQRRGDGQRRRDARRRPGAGPAGACAGPEPGRGAYPRIPVGDRTGVGDRQRERHDGGDADGQPGHARGRAAELRERSRSPRRAAR